MIAHDRPPGKRSRTRHPRELHPRLEAGNLRGVYLREPEALLAEILQGRADQVQLLVVEDEEAVMEVLAYGGRRSPILNPASSVAVRLEVTNCDFQCSVSSDES